MTLVKPTLAGLLRRLLGPGRTDPVRGPRARHAGRRATPAWRFALPGSWSTCEIDAPTKGEARALLKADRGIPRKGRLPVGVVGWRVR